MKKRVKFGERWVGENEPCYVISEIGSNFDGTLEGARKLVDLSVEVGADCVKFQSFLPEKIIAKGGFENRLGFQRNWEKSVWQVYSEASFPRHWHRDVAEYANEKGIQFSSSPYDREAVDLLMELDVPFIKIGSGEITNHEFLKYIARTNKPLILGTGASTIADVAEAVEAIVSTGNDKLVLLQCITNYPSAFENSNIRAMVTMRETFGCGVGYSDHTPGSIVPIAAVALGAGVIEKHFTHDTHATGPDHPFAMNVETMREMVRGIRTLERALGSPQKFVTADEQETVIIQRRSLFTTRSIPKGTSLTAEMLEPLRPAIGVAPKYASFVVGMVVQRDLGEGEPLTWEALSTGTSSAKAAGPSI
jgi:sialic acid synthase SpsE